VCSATRSGQCLEGVALGGPGRFTYDLDSSRSSGSQLAAGINPRSKRMSDGSVKQEIVDAFEGLRAGLIGKDRPELEAIHDPEFIATELHNELMTAEEHIDAAMVAEIEGFKFHDIEVMDLGRLEDGKDIAIAWGSQYLKGRLRPEDIGADNSADIEAGIVFVFTAVWRKWPDRWKVLTYHVSTRARDQG
jgi:hypothetical protein